MKFKILTLLLITGLISACGSQPIETPSPTEESVAATQAPTNIPLSTDTAIPTDTEAPIDSPTVSSGNVSFANDILPIIQSRCLTCHGGDRGAEEGLDMNSHANLMAGSENGPVVLAGNADGSLMVEMLIQNKMPKRGPKLTPPQVQLIIDWINQGALNN
jgi:hypothetical protein